VPQEKEYSFRFTPLIENVKDMKAVALEIQKPYGSTILQLDRFELFNP